MGLLDEKIIKRPNIISAAADKVFNWSRLSSLWLMIYGIACCSIESFAIGGPRYDVERFGIAGRASARQADVLLILGPVTKKMAPVLRTLYAQMPEPKYVVACGSCAITGGAFQDSFFVIQGVQKVIPVDVYVPGCHPRAESFLYGFLKLQEHIRNETLVKGRPGPLKEPIIVPEALSVGQKQELGEAMKDEEKV